MKVRPLADRVLVKPEKLNLKPQAESSFRYCSGKTQTAVVIAVGDDKEKSK